MSVMISFRISIDDDEHLRGMLRDAGLPHGSSLSQFAKGLLLDVIADDRKTHQPQPQREAAQ